MAFFKLRFPGQAASAEAVTAGPNENIEVVRRRARHRLIGAGGLVLVAVVGFPLLFDAQPRPVAVDTPIVIPDRQAVSPLSGPAPVPAEQAPAKPLLPSPEVSTQASLGAREEVVLPTEKAADQPAEKQTAAPEEVKPSAPVKNEKSDKAEKSEKSEKSEKPSASAAAKDDASKAQALLDGKADAAATGRFVIQAGAFSEAAKVREVRRKLEQAGFKTYTQVVEKDGKSTTRIRVGPFPSREEADKVVARIRKLDLQASVLKL